MDTPAPKILVIDDNAQNRELARATLEDEGYTVSLAASGDEGIRACEADAPDCVLLDVRMPGMDGFEVCARIRSLPGRENIPVVFLTALRDIDTFEQALRAGGDDFLTKPVRPTELVLRVQGALKLRRMSSELRDYYELVRRQRDDLMRLQLQKERLASFVVHDLKNPVNSLDLYAQLLLRDASLPERAKQSVLHIRAEARALLRLVLNLLDISKSEEGRLTARLADVDVKALIGGIREAFVVRGQAAGVSFLDRIDVPTLRADPDLLLRVIENLVDNAFRYAPDGSQIVLSILRDGGDVEVRVADGGTGVPLDLRDKIFDRFVQGGPEQALVTRTGRGLGLAFCKLAVEAHGGSIWIEDGQPGAVFCVRIPG